MNGFRIKNIVFKKRQKNAVLNPCPYIPVNKLSDASCYATLLLHVPWPYEGESKISCDNVSFVDQLDTLQKHKLLPDYVVPLLERVEKSQNLFVNAANQDDETRFTSSDDDEDEIMYCQHDNLHDIAYDEKWVSNLPLMKTVL